MGRDVYGTALTGKTSAVAFLLAGPANLEHYDGENVPDRLQAMRVPRGRVLTGPIVGQIWRSSLPEGLGRAG